VTTEWVPANWELYAGAVVTVTCPRCEGEVDVPVTVHSYINADNQVVIYTTSADVGYHECPVPEDLFEVVGALVYDAETDSLTEAPA